MSRVTPCLVLGATLALGACAVAPPTGPSVMALPGPGKNLPDFQRDDAGCRQYADQQIGYGSPAAAATQSGVGSALIGTGLGAAAGALLGVAAGSPGVGAAIGAGSGLLLGSAVGANTAAASGLGMQQRYDIAYTQCMYASGNQVQPGPGPAAYPYAYAPYGPPGYYGY
jgi:hypothetical protein